VGEEPVAPERMEKRKLLFTVPGLPEGWYAVSLRNQHETFPSGFTLHILEVEPRIELITPSEIDACSSPEERTLAILGVNFKPGAIALLDGAAVSSLQSEKNEITFIAPPLEEGIHKVQVANPGGLQSLPHMISVNGIPEIFSVAQGEEEVLSYELIIHGKNFLYQSTLVVNDISIDPNNGGTRPPIFRPHTGSVKYLDCNTIIYHRRPVSTQIKQISLQVVNPGGKQSPVHYVTVP